MLSWRQIFGNVLKNVGETDVTVKKKKWHIQEVLEKFKNQFKDADVSDIKGHLAYQFNIVGDGADAFYAKVNESKLSIKLYEYYDRDVLFTCKADVLFKIILGKIDPVAAFTLGKLEVEGALKRLCRSRVR